MKTALLSVNNKDGIVEFARQIKDLGFKIYASGGTAKVLSSAGVETSDVADLIGGGAILGHRVVTLSREIYAGLLSRETDEDKAELEKLKIPRIDLVCADLYPLEETINKVLSSENNSPSTFAKATADRQPPLTLRGVDEVIEKTDIGGPALLRAAAKGRRIVICDPLDRSRVVEWIKQGEPEKEAFLSELAAKAEFTVANYALISAKYHSHGKYDGIILSEIAECKYGENAWQVPAGLFAINHLSPVSSTGQALTPSPSAGRKKDSGDPLSLSNFKIVAGTAPSYNNWADVDRLLQTATHIAAGFEVNKITPSLPSRPLQGEEKKWNIAIGVKHGNPCGASVSLNPLSVIRKMLEGDLRAIFGGLVMVNFEIDEKLAEVLLSHRMENNQRRLLDGVIAPSFTTSAIATLKRKGDKCRLLVNPALALLSKNSLDTRPRFRYVRGGFLKQPNYNFILDFKHPEIEIYNPSSASVEVSADKHSPLILRGEAMRDIILAWAVGSTSNSNTITIVKDSQLLGNGVGQQDRVGGCELAIKRAIDTHHDLQKATAYSDSFFPFPDGPLKLIEAGIKVICATRGSVKDEEIKKTCINKGITFVTLPDSLARGFFGH